MSAEKTITAKDFQDFAQHRLFDATIMPSLFRDRLKDVIDFAVANETSMDAGAKAYYDNLLEGIAT